MGYSSEALSLRKPDVIELPRLKDRISYLYFDRARIEQDRTGIIVYGVTDNGSYSARIPSASLNFLLLAHGTSITNPAMLTLNRGGCTVVFYGEGMSGAAAATPLTSRAGWIQAQARMWASPKGRAQAAIELYTERFGSDFAEVEGENALRVLRGAEGQRMKNKYREMSKKYKYPKWRRESNSEFYEDPVNPLINLGNSILYGAAAAACSALGVSPGLGVIHQGASHAFLFDLADIHKASSTIPLAFKLAHRSDASTAMRRAMRDWMVANDVFETMIIRITNLLTPFYQSAEQDTLMDVSKSVPGHTNYSNKPKEAS